MSDDVALGTSDATQRWVGIRRHQAALLIAGLGITGDGVLRTSAGVLELVLGATLLIAALPMYDGLTGGELVLAAGQYVGRNRWTTIVVERTGRDLTVSARGRADVHGYELVHHGRLDLSGLDVIVAQTLAAFTDGLAASESSRHVSVHVRTGSEDSQTLLTLRGDTAPPDGWRPHDALVAEVAGVQLANSLWLLERWRYVRAPHEVTRVLRIRDFTAVPSGSSPFERLQQSSKQLTLALHFDVVGDVRAHRIAERAVHRLRSDAAVSHAVGFRQTARIERSLERLVQRETLVANGRALLRVAVFLTVRASTCDELNRAVHDVLRSAHESGLRCERGLGRQALWYSYQLPGGPGW